MEQCREPGENEPRIGDEIALVPGTWLMPLVGEQIEQRGDGTAVRFRVRFRARRCGP